MNSNDKLNWIVFLAAPPIGVLVVFFLDLVEAFLVHVFRPRISTSRLSWFSTAAHSLSKTLLKTIIKTINIFGFRAKLKDRLCPRRSDAVAHVIRAAINCILQLVSFFIVLCMLILMLLELKPSVSRNYIAASFCLFGAAIGYLLSYLAESFEKHNKANSGEGGHSHLPLKGENQLALYVVISIHTFAEGTSAGFLGGDHHHGHSHRTAEGPWFLVVLFLHTICECIVMLGGLRNQTSPYYKGRLYWAIKAIIVCLGSHCMQPVGFWVGANFNKQYGKAKSLAPQLLNLWISGIALGSLIVALNSAFLPQIRKSLHELIEAGEVFL